MASTIKRNPKILNRETTALVLIDIQEKILNVMAHKVTIVDKTVRLIKGFKELNVPIFYTEQYPKGLGQTAAPILKELEGLSPIQKMSFSCYGALNFFDRLIANKINQVVVAGIESHVCVQQTVLDLLANEYQVNVCADAVSSRSQTDYDFALERMRTNGAEITTTEAVLFELLNVCGTNEFKAISKIVK